MAERIEIEGPLDGLRFAIDQVGDRDASTVIWLHSEWGALAEPPLESSVTDVADVRVVHLPGWGVSQGVERFDRIDDLATALWWLLDRTVDGSVILAGHGFGATLGLELAVQQPQRVDGVVAAAPFGIVDEDEPGADFFGLLPKHVLPHLYADPESPLVAEHFPTPADAHEKGLASIRRVEVLGATSRFLFPLPDTGIAQRLYRLHDTPVHLLWGELDGLVPLAVTSSWTRLLPKATSEVVAGTAHMLPYESDAVSKALASMLEDAATHVGT